MKDNFINKQTISKDTGDMSREVKPFFVWDPSRALITSIRSYQNADQAMRCTKTIVKKWAILRHRFWSMVTGTDIPVTVSIGAGLLIPHPNGIIIHGDSSIGINCLIFQQVTIGSRNGSAPPIIGNNVDIGAGAKIIGSIKIGDYAKIGANAVVLTDVPAQATAVGIPAKIL